MHCNNPMFSDRDLKTEWPIADSERRTSLDSAGYELQVNRLIPQWGLEQFSILDLLSAWKMHNAYHLYPVSSYTLNTLSLSLAHFLSCFSDVWACQVLNFESETESSEFCLPRGQNSHLSSFTSPCAIILSQVQILHQVCLSTFQTRVIRMYYFLNARASDDVIYM